MATYTVSTSQNYTTVNGGVFNDYDRITITSGATLTINTNTNIIEQILCNTLGLCVVENTGTIMPIFVKTGADSWNGLIRFEAWGKLEVRGDFIEIWTSDGTAGQEFTLPTNILLENIPSIWGVFVYETWETTPDMYVRVPTLTDTFWDKILGSNFTHDSANNKIIFWDGTNGFIPPNWAVIKIPNIFFIDESVSGYTDFDVSTSGTLDFDVVAFGDNYAHNYVNASSVIIKNFCYWWARELMNVWGQDNPYLENGAIVFDDTADYINFSGCNNTKVLNLNMYNTWTWNNYFWINITNWDLGLVDGFRVCAPDINSGSSRYWMFLTSSNITINNSYIASHWGWFSFWGGSSWGRVNDCWYCGQWKRWTTWLWGQWYAAWNTGDIIIQRSWSYPLLPTDGAYPSNTYLYWITTGTSNVTIHDCDTYAGQVGDASRTNNILRTNWAGHRFNKVRIYWYPSSWPVNTNSGTSNTKVTNVTFMDPYSWTVDAAWSNWDFHDLVSTADKIWSSPSKEWKNVGTFHYYYSNDKTSGRLFKPMWANDSSDYFQEISVSGKVLFNNAGRMYMDTAWDIVEFYSDIHKGITWFTWILNSWSTLWNFTIEFAIRNPGGTYTALQTMTNANVSWAVAALPWYDSNVWLQIKYRITRDTSNVINYVTYLWIYTTIDPLYEVPFIVSPSRLTLNGLKENTEIRVYDSSAPEIEIAGEENVNDGVFEYDFDGWEITSMNIQIHCLWFQNIYLKDIDTSWGDVSIPVQQIFDRQYSNS